MKEETLILTQADPVLFYGVNNANFRLLRILFPKVKLVARGNIVKITGEPKEVDECLDRMAAVERHIAKFNTINDETLIELVKGGKPDVPVMDNLILFGQNGKPVTARTAHQKQLVEAFDRDDLMIAIGPAGSGKTYTAIALAVKALKAKQVRRIILCRPAVEAGEKLGFLPGDMKDKIDPYLQPLYDALEDMIPPFKLKEYMETNVIQIAPLAFMRGRTLGDAVVILDEAQNTTPAQFKMFLTRLGFHSKMIITGDDTQIDLPRGTASGMVHSYPILEGVKGVSIIRFDKKDIVRHPLVSRMVEAYDQYERREKEHDRKPTEKQQE
ncbi:MAG: PhoH family protein [Paludibacteraceae bacterium]|nr:PhoH family protein [Paludibacteraceae bacterium]